MDSLLFSSNSTDNTIKYNKESWEGIIVLRYTQNTRITNNIITNNKMYNGNSGAINKMDTSKTTIKNNTIKNNQHHQSNAFNSTI